MASTVRSLASSSMVNAVRSWHPGRAGVAVKSPCKARLPYFPGRGPLGLGKGGFGGCITDLGRAVLQKNVRKLWAPSPVRMGRRSAKIATRKGAADMQKSKVYGKIGKQIISAVKLAGPDPVTNVQLATVLQAAKQANVPKDIIDRNIKKASDKNQADYVEVTYEIYGAAGVGIVAEIFTDNLNRSSALVRDVVKKGGGKMAEPGSVMFNFAQKGVVAVPEGDITGDDILLAAMDAGAEDIVEPNADEDEDEGDRFYRVLTPQDQLFSVRTALQEAGIPIIGEHCGLQLIPNAKIEVDDDAREVNQGIIDKLLEIDDVDTVISNMAD